MALKGWNGAFSGRVGLKFFAYVGYTGYNGNTGIKPNILINLAGDKVGGRGLREHKVCDSITTTTCLEDQ